MILLSRVLILAILQCSFSSWPLPAHASRLRCADVPIAFESDASQDMACICETARATIAFLKKLGLETTEVITIKLVDDFPSQPMQSLIGSYNPASREVSLRAYAAVEKLSRSQESTLRIEINEDLWCSYAAHELAHAISSQYLDPEINDHTAGEYISAVTQLAVLTPESRQQMLQAYQDIEAYQSMHEISILYFLFAPNAFAVKCYLHFISLDQPKAFIDRLVREDNGFGRGY